MLKELQLVAWLLGQSDLASELTGLLTRIDRTCRTCRRLYQHVSRRYQLARIKIALKNGELAGGLRRTNCSRGLAPDSEIGLELT